MGKWTQGPWKFEAGFGCKQIRGGKNGQHRQAQYSDIAYTVGRNNEDEDAANARLIAAAPELVEALMAFVEYNDMADSGCCDVATMIAYADALEKARAALAKAGAK